MFAVLSTFGFWLRIDITFIPGYGILYSIDWWSLYMALMSQVTQLHAFVFSGVNLKKKVGSSAPTK